ncbi:ECF RNA polymerase sigma factor SigK [Aeromicrobium sp. Leaf350]|uniref:ECF RNA polymerase sigma factor SigK n=1 Tax=Aeromicrobium sp. Leaf350 TaxID=2876565 RepID=UPI001E4E292E|nr:ECF RNA polymerase sigma factor SigK [Aeromicrobium sp. Leaf350]
MPPTSVPSSPDDKRHLSSVDDAPALDLDDLLVRTARGDDQAFAALYDALGSSVHGLTRRLLRNPARAEEVTQEVFLQVWRTATRFDPERGRAKTWVLVLAHRRAVDAIRHDQAASDREDNYDWVGGPDHDVVSEEVIVNLEHEQVRRCMDGLTELQRESVNLAYYGGYTYPEVAELLDANLATVKTRMRDGLIRLRDCMGVTA